MNLPGKVKPQWAGRDIFHPNDEGHLQATAGLYELGEGMPRHEAEHRAYQEYVRARQVEAAAHHYRCLQAALAHGDKDAAMRHSAMYAAHQQAIGGDPTGLPHPDVKSHLDRKPGKAKFVPHKADALINPEVTKSEGYRESLDRALKVLAKAFPG